MVKVVEKSWCCFALGGLGKVELLFQRLLTTTDTKCITKYSTNYTVGNLLKGEATHLKMEPLG